MNEELRRRLQEEGARGEPAPVEDIMARGTALHRQRRRRRTAAVATGLVVLALGAVFTVNQVRNSAVSVHVTGTPAPAATNGETPTPNSTSLTNVLTATEQREVAVYTALLRYEIAQLTPTGTATTPSPSLAPFYVQDQIFGLAPTATAADPNRFKTLSQVGLVPAAVQGGIVNTLAPTPIVFVPNVQGITVAVPSAGGCTKIIGSGYMFMLGSVPSTGDQIQVYAGWSGVGPLPGPGGHNAVYDVAQTGNSWMITGTVGLPQSMLGGCG